MAALSVHSLGGGMRVTKPSVSASFASAAPIA